MKMLKRDPAIFESVPSRSALPRRICAGSSRPDFLIRGLLPADEGFLEHVFGIGHAAQHSISEGYDFVTVGEEPRLPSDKPGGLNGSMQHSPESPI
jgi:hypothetical protein